MNDLVKVEIRETHNFKGNFPEVATYDHVDTAMLYEGDEKPFHITLPIAEVGRRSTNDILYDEELVTEIAAQLPGLGGGRGHVPEGQEDSAYPLDAVDWVGHKLENGVLWAKGYVPPGQDREDIRRKKARGGNIGTSIYGHAVKEMDGKQRGYRLRKLDLEKVDLAPHKRASLKHMRGFEITREMETEGYMPVEINSVADVPESIREQIIRDAKVRVDASRVSELETENGKLKTEVAEMRQYATIVGEIRQTLGKDTDVIAAFTEYHNQIGKIAEMLGVPYTNISVRVEEMHEQIAEMKKREFGALVDTTIAEFTDWEVRSDEAKKQLEAFRKTIRRSVIAELGVERKPEKVKEIATKLWEDEFSIQAEMYRDSLAGPSALVGGKRNKTDAQPYASDEARTALKAQWGF